MYLLWQKTITKVADLVQVEAMAPIEDIENTNLKAMEGEVKEEELVEGTVWKPGSFR